ncbi:MFS transporter [Quadrisphaera sp. KR29]|uniref:MFS transporter n=1 Tax=Quadrisphaera sp. KR29 TaxID=3461391 RepID=UPI004044C7FC
MPQPLRAPGPGGALPSAPTSGPPARRTGRGAASGLPVLALAVVVLVALNVRGPLAARPPVTGDLRADLAVSAGAVGLLTTLPVLCFGAATPLASWVVARWGLRAAVLACLVGVLVGTLVRSAGGYPAALAGTAVLGLAITVGNIAMPVLISEDFPASVGLVTALYAAAFNVGSTLTTAVTPVLAAPLGWRGATAAWGVLAVAALLVVAAVHRRPRASSGSPRAAARTPRERPEPHPVPVHRRATTWLLVTAFAGQSFSYYGTTAWLPELLADRLGAAPEAAGVGAAVFQVAAVAGAFGVPAVLRATGRPRIALWLVCAGWATLPLGLLLAPGLWWAWAALAGAAQGGGITVILVAAVSRGREVRAGRPGGPADVRAASALVQGGGYLAGALGPVVVGAAHDASGGWTVPLLVLLASVTALLAAGTAGVPRREAAPA